MKKTTLLLASLPLLVAIAAEPPAPPSREEWGFLQELKRREPYTSHWTRTAKPGELDLSNGVRVVDGYGVKGDLKTATADLADFLADVKLSGGSVPLRLVRQDCGAKEAYRIDVAKDGVTLSAGDDDGLRRAVYRFEDMLLGSDAPALALGATSRRPWVRNRISRCFFGPIKRPPFNRDELLDDIDYYPEAYLNRLAHEGINGLWLTIEFRDIAKTSFFTPSPEADRRLAKLRRTVEKCRRYGIGTWIFCIEPRRLEDLPELRKRHPEIAGTSLHGEYTVTCTATETARRYLEEATESIFREVPALKGIINISHGERPTTCLSTVSPTGEVRDGLPFFKNANCPRCGKLQPWQIHLNTVTSMLKGMRRVNPEAEFISWFYQPHVLPERAPWVYEAARHVPDGITLLYNFESGALKDQCGRMRTGGDYWLSFTGPSMSFERVAEAASNAGSSLGAKIQVGCSHEVATVPFVPVPGLLYRKYKAMKEAGVSTVMQCWYFGNYPGIMNKAAGELSFDDFAEDENAFLERLARPEWGADAPQVARLWRNLSDAYACYPLSNDMQYYGPFHAGAAWPLHADVRLKPLGRTWKPLDAPSGDTIGEALENHTLEEAITLADRMAAGSRALTPDGRDAYRALAAKYAGNRPRQLDAGVMNALALLFESGRDIFRFYRARSEALDLSRNRGDAAGARKCVAEMTALVRREQEITREMRDLAAKDSRLGFHSEAECHQFHPAKLTWRLAELDTTLSDLADIDAALARGEPYPESAFEKTAPSCRTGEWAEGKGFRFRVDETPGGDLKITVRTAQKSVSAYTFDAAGTLWQRGASIDANGKVTSPLAWNVVTPGHAASGSVRRDGDAFEYTLVLAADGWGRETRLRPEWLALRTANGCVWPAVPQADYRLNLGCVQGDRFGRILRAAPARGTARRKGRKGRVTVLHTNDTHSHIDDGLVAFSAIAAEKARLEAEGENVILVDAGDYVQGTALGGYDEGRSAIEIMNAAGYDVATLGNHEFDYGIKAMFENAKRAAFKTVSCNFISRDSADGAGRLVFPPYTVVTSGTVRVAFVGVTTPTTLVSAKPSTFLDPTGSWRAYDFIAGERGEALYAAVQSAVNEAAAHADYTVVLGHLGISPDCAGYMSTDVIAHTTNFVALVDGHSHSEYTGSRVRNAAGEDVILTQSGSYLGLLGALTFDDGKCVAAGTIYARGEKDGKVARLEKNLADAVERQLGVKIANAPVALCSYRPGSNERIARKEECSAGDFAADAALWYTVEKSGLECDMALMNGGNVRADVPAGDVTLKTLRTVQPFGGAIGLVEANGRQILDSLEFGAQAVGDGEFGGFIQVAGLKYTVDATVKSSVRVDATGSWMSGPTNGVYRVKDVQVYDRKSGSFKPLDPNAVYRVAGNAFTLVEGGDGFSMFRSAKKVENGLATDYLVLADYAKAFKPGPDGKSALTSANAPLAALPGYPVDYEKPNGSGRITILGLR